MVAHQMDQKWLGPPRKTPQNDGYVSIINMHGCNTTNSLKYKRRRIRRRRIAPTRRIRRDQKKKKRITKTKDPKQKKKGKTEKN